VTEWSSLQIIAKRYTIEIQEKMNGMEWHGDEGVVGRWFRWLTSQSTKLNEKSKMR